MKILVCMKGCSWSGGPSVAIETEVNRFVPEQVKPDRFERSSFWYDNETGYPADNCFRPNTALMEEHNAIKREWQHAAEEWSARSREITDRAEAVRARMTPITPSDVQEED